MPQATCVLCGLLSGWQRGHWKEGRGAVGYWGLCQCVVHSLGAPCGSEKCSNQPSQQSAHMSGLNLREGQKETQCVLP